MEKIPQKEYDKAKTQLRLQLNGVFEPLRAYGQGLYCDGAIEEVLELAEKFAMRVRGKDIPINFKERYGRK